jgi:hypothetical protein
MKKVIQIFVLIFMSLAVSSCYYDYIPAEDIEDPENLPEVSYADDIIPIWVGYCITNCHDGTIPPDLRNDVSYDELLDGYVVPGNANDSVLYQSLLGSDGIELMPPGDMMSDELISLVRNWINQGALNN